MNAICRRRLALMVAGLLLIAAPASAQPEDADLDGYADEIDNCPVVYNPDQNDICVGDGLLESSVAGAALSAAPVLLYDVDFGTPPHTVGQPPVLGGGPAPRNVPTRIYFGSPTVVAAAGVMDQQPLLLPGPGAPYDQLYFATGLAYGGFDVQYPTYHFELTVMVVEIGDELVIFFDGPLAHAVRFKSDGRINARALGASGYIETIGQWEAGVPRRLVVDIDRPAEQWTIALDGEEVFSGAYPSPSEMRTLRPSASGGTIAALDDVIVMDRPRGCTLDVNPSLSGGILRLDFTLGTGTPANFNIWLSAFDLVVPFVTAVPIPAVDPPVSFPVDLPVPAHLGGIGVLTTITDAGGIQCSAWKTIDIPPGGIGDPR